MAQADIRDGIIQAARALGINPADLATIISYETGGTFDPTQAGPTTQWGQHRGLIQFGEPQAKANGVDWANPVGSQLGPDGAIVRYLKGAGVKPGMGLMDIYSAVNAGSVGKYGATDAHNGGAPGTVADKVRTQMAGHQAKAQALLGNVAPAYSAGPGRGSMAGYRTPGSYEGGEYVPGVEKTFYDDRSPMLPGNQGQGVGASLGGFSGGMSQVAARNPNIQNAAISGTGDMRPTNFQRNAARQAMEGDQSQRARLLQAAGLDPTGKTRVSPRGTSESSLGGILDKLKAGAANNTGPGLDVKLAAIPHMRLRREPCDCPGAVLLCVVAVRGLGEQNDAHTILQGLQVGL